MEAAVPASYADIEIKKRIDALRKTKGANVAKTAIARWLVKVIFHVLKERRPYITSYKVIRPELPFSLLSESAKKRIAL